MRQPYIYQALNSVKRGADLPHKIAYLNSGSNAWDHVSKDPRYSLGTRELSTLRKFLKSVAPQLSKESFNILHIGPGNGVEIPTIVNTIGVERIAQYVLVDISPKLIEIGESVLKKCSKNLSFFSFVRDVTKPGISKIAKKIRARGAKRNLIVFIAQGAILSNSPILKYTRNCMKPDDRLLITLELYSPDRERQILEQYKLGSIIALFANSLSVIGIDAPSLDQFEFSYNEKKSIMEVFFRMNRWIKEQPERAKSFAGFPDRFRIFASLKPTTLGLRRILSTNGFKIEDMEYFERENCCGILCSAPAKR